MKIFFLGLVLSFLLVGGEAFSIPPPKIIKETNLKAKVIVIGKVEEIVSLKEQSYLELKIVHVIKGYGVVKEKEKIKVFFNEKTLQKEGIVAHKMGEVDVKVKKGDLVVCYLEPLKDGFKPRIGGLSVVRIAYNEDL
ncbi:MAG: hypothetical protein DRG39_03070 [Deltaproteobacteria bacterium]|nr:MAG: hypothetical protein DRG39_03070 [Deltaproteobacteria bacterium]